MARQAAAMRAKVTVPLCSIGASQRLVHEISKTFNFRKIKSENFKKGKFEWVGNVTHSVWLVRLRAGNLVDNCIVVNGVRRMILDGDEKKPVHLSTNALRSCGGDNAPRLYIAEVRELYNSHPKVD